MKLRTVTVRLELQTTETLGRLRDRTVWQAMISGSAGDTTEAAHVAQVSVQVAQPPKPQKKKARK